MRSNASHLRILTHRQTRYGSWHQNYLAQQTPVKVQQLSDQERIKQLERENKELQRANEILRKAAAFFAQAELDRPHK